LDVKLRPYPVYKDSGLSWLGKIPAHWEAVRLKKVCQFAYGDSLPTESRANGNIPVYGSNGWVGLHEKANTSSPYIVVRRKGSFGKVNYSSQPVFAIDTTFYVDRRFTQDNLCWLFYILGWARLDAFSRDSAVPGLDRNDTYQRLLPWCPAEDQTAIARFLDASNYYIRRFIRSKQRLIKLLEEQKQVIIHRAVTRGLDPNVRLKPSGVEWLGEVPEHWGLVQLRRLVSFVTSGSRGWANFYSETGDIFLQSGNLG
jgi:type I restriction enzyme S subunit